MTESTPESPPEADVSRREKRIQFRVSDEEYARIKAHANAYSVQLAELVRRAALRVRVAAPVGTENVERWRDLGRLALNLNAGVRQSHILSRRLDESAQTLPDTSRVTRDELASMVEELVTTTRRVLVVVTDIRALLIDEWEVTRGIEIANESRAMDGDST